MWYDGIIIVDIGIVVFIIMTVAVLCDDNDDIGSDVMVLLYCVVLCIIVVVLVLTV